MANTDLTSVLATLEAERADLARDLGELDTESPTAQAFDENFADSAQVTAELVENQALAASLRDRLADVESAIARLEAGTYGTCEECGTEISAARLEAMPSTRFCIDHA